MLYDRDIREPLFEFLEETYGKNRIIEEKRIGKSRADVVMVLPDSLVGIEIKSDADTYARLESQVKDYNLYFDKNIVVVGTKHAGSIKTHVPQWWGIITVEQVGNSVDFYVYQDMQINPKSIKKDGTVPVYYMKRQLSFLWRPELVNIQSKNDMHRYAAKSKAFVIQKIMECVPWDKLKLEICEELFERDYNQIAATIDAYRVSKGNKPRRRKRVSKSNADKVSEDKEV